MPISTVGNDADVRQLLNVSMGVRVFGSFPLSHADWRSLSFFL